MMLASNWSNGAQIRIASCIGGADFDTALGGQTARNPQHLGAVCLHWEVLQTAPVRLLANLDTPAEDGIERAGDRGLIDRRVRPAPKCWVCLSVGAKQIPRGNRRSGDANRKCIGSYAVLDIQDALLE
jgi:hypothetical protein